MVGVLRCTFLCVRLAVPVIYEVGVVIARGGFLLFHPVSPVRVV